MINISHAFQVNKHCNYLITMESARLIHNMRIVEDMQFGTLEINKTKISFDYFTGDFNIITINIVAETNVNTTITQNNIAIKQIYIAEHLLHFLNDILESYPNLVMYHNHYQPAIFYGMWSRKDHDVISKNKSLKIIVWTGSDIYIDTNNIKLKKMVSSTIDKIRKLTKIKHIAISSFIRNDLIKLGMDYIDYPFMGISLDKFHPVTKGPCIYVYTSPCLGDKYGEKLYSQIVKRYPNIEFIFTCCKESTKFIKTNENIYNIKHYDKSLLVEQIYPKCFINLRLTNHDGLAGSVQELGAMGIKSVHNGSSPSCLNYDSLEDICKHIDNEMKTIGTKDVELSNKVKKYLTVDPNFFTTNFYADVVKNQPKISYS